MAKLQLHASPTSPFVHKVLIAARELGIRDDLDVIYQTLSPFSPPNEQVTSANPIGKIPVLVVPNASPIFDSCVIVQYLDNLAKADKKIIPPADDPRKFEVLTIEALGNAVLDAALLVRYETALRPKEERSETWIKSQQGKMQRGLAKLMTIPLPPADSPAPLPLEGIVVANVLWYLNLRYPELAWWEWQGGPALKAWNDKVKERKGWSEDDAKLV